MEKNYSTASRKTCYLEEILELAKCLSVYQQKLSELDSLDVVAWCGDGFHYGRLTVREIAKHSQRIQEANFDKPIIISCEGWLMDGFHRVAKAFLKGMEFIPAVKFEVDPEPNRISTWHDWHEATLRE